MKKLYFAKYLLILISLFMGCEPPPQHLYPQMEQQLSKVDRGDFIQLKDDRVLPVSSITCDTKTPMTCMLTLRDGQSNPIQTSERWAPQVEKIIRYGDPAWAELARKLIRSQSFGCY